MSWGKTKINVDQETKHKLAVLGERIIDMTNGLSAEDTCYLYECLHASTLMSFVDIGIDKEDVLELLDAINERITKSIKEK